MNPAVRFTLGLCVLAPAFAAQPDFAPSPARSVAAAAGARAEAIAAFQAGNPTAALAKLRASVSRGAAAFAEDTQVVSRLCSIARELAATAPGSGRTAGLAAVAEGERARSHLPRREAAVVDLDLGGLHEFTLGDPVRARAHYTAALASPATAPAARHALARLSWRDALIATKARENAALRQRSP